MTHCGPFQFSKGMFQSSQGMTPTIPPLLSHLVQAARTALLLLSVLLAPQPCRSSPYDQHQTLAQGVITGYWKWRGRAEQARCREGGSREDHAPHGSLLKGSHPFPFQWRYAQCSQTVSISLVNVFSVSCNAINCVSKIVTFIMPLTFLDLSLSLIVSYQHINYVNAHYI